MTAPADGGLFGIALIREALPRPKKPPASLAAEALLARSRESFCGGGADMRSRSSPFRNVFCRSSGRSSRRSITVEVDRPLWLNEGAVLTLRSAAVALSPPPKPKNAPSPLLRRLTSAGRGDGTARELDGV